MNRASPTWTWSVFFLLVSFLAGATAERAGWLHGRTTCPPQRTLEPLFVAPKATDCHVAPAPVMLVTTPFTVSSVRKTTTSAVLE